MKYQITHYTVNSSQYARLQENVNGDWIFKRKFSFPKDDKAYKKWAASVALEEVEVVYEVEYYLVQRFPSHVLVYEKRTDGLYYTKYFLRPQQDKEYREWLNSTTAGVRFTDITNTPMTTIPDLSQIPPSMCPGEFYRT